MEPRNKLAHTGFGHAPTSKNLRRVVPDQVRRARDLVLHKSDFTSEVVFVELRVGVDPTSCQKRSRIKLATNALFDPHLEGRISVVLS